MEQLDFDIITVAFFGLGVLSLAFAIWAVRAFTKPIGGDEYFADDAPARYEDYEDAFYNPEI